MGTTDHSAGAYTIQVVKQTIHVLSTWYRQSYHGQRRDGYI